MAEKASSNITTKVFISNYYRRSLVFLVGQMFFKGSKIRHFIMKSYFYKSLMTEEGRF
jgi:hypothetical protein